MDNFLKSQDNYNNSEGGFSRRNVEIGSILSIIIKKLFVAMEFFRRSCRFDRRIENKIHLARERSFFQT